MTDHAETARDQAIKQKERAERAEAVLERVVGQAWQVAHVDNWQHRCSDGVGGCTAVSASRLEALREVLAPFESPASVFDAIRVLTTPDQEGS